MTPPLRDEGEEHDRNTERVMVRETGMVEGTVRKQGWSQCVCVETAVHFTSVKARASTPFERVCWAELDEGERVTSEADVMVRVWSTQ